MNPKKDESTMGPDPPDFLHGNQLPKSQATAPTNLETAASVLFPGLLSGSVDIAHLAQNLIDENGIRFFILHSQDISKFWISLLRKTYLPDGITHNHVLVTKVLKTVEDMITSSGIERHFVRLVWIRLTNILDRFDEVIKTDRRACRLGKDVGHRDASIAIKIHQKSISAQRSEISWRGRIAKRWILLTNGSLFLATAYSSRAETLVYVPLRRWRLSLLRNSGETYLLVQKR
ncbi:hypothetical protein B0T10DRAFT_501806 [Thelonectria olida]|uniref:Uncharacterized protein n=1 Tax=Thelonectria olida TaxID=1576542 RepID=A0A9P8VR29_9HYPO|nr:hypothetical protein B0T10DRAFT_501806 [Thelonectria olida]